MTPGEIGGIERGKGDAGLRKRGKGTVNVARVPRHEKEKGKGRGG